eukprot:15080836-Alexandrium_andersonii.AAC.1
MHVGVDCCPLVGYCAQPPSPDTIAMLTAKHALAWQSAHSGLRAVDSALRGYSTARHGAMASNQGLCSVAGP